jgi:hypothetical protein
MQKNKNIHKSLEKLAKKVDDSFRGNGVAIPFPDGHAIGVHGYRIVKVDSSNYTIMDSRHNLVVDKINLAQTAVLVANDLSLGRMINNDLINEDKKYGYLQFEQMVCSNSKARSLKRKDYDRAEYLEDKYNIASHRAAAIKIRINREFEKLQARINNLITSGN